MPIQTVTIAEPSLTIRFLRAEEIFPIFGKTITLNLLEQPLRIREQTLGHLQSVILANTEMKNVRCVVVERFADYADQAALLAEVRDTWLSAFDVRGEERPRGISHYMSPKVWKGQYGFTMYFSGTVPLKVGLHRNHEFCPVPGFREVHTQIVGFGKMQPFREQNLETLYLEEPMAPGTTHRPIYDELGNYPWHQFETITPSIFMATEILPEDAIPPT